MCEIFSLTRSVSPSHLNVKDFLNRVEAFQESKREALQAATESRVRQVPNEKLPFASAQLTSNNSTGNLLHCTLIVSRQRSRRGKSLKYGCFACLPVFDIQTFAESHRGYGGAESERLFWEDIEDDFVCRKVHRTNPSHFCLRTQCGRVARQSHRS